MSNFLSEVKERAFHLFHTLPKPSRLSERGSYIKELFYSDITMAPRRLFYTMNALTTKKKEVDSVITIAKRRWNTKEKQELGKRFSRGCLLLIARSCLRVVQHYLQELFTLKRICVFEDFSLLLYRCRGNLKKHACRTEDEELCGYIDEVWDRCQQIIIARDACSIHYDQEILMENQDSFYAIQHTRQFEKIPHIIYEGNQLLIAAKKHLYPLSSLKNPIPLMQKLYHQAKDLRKELVALDRTLEDLAHLKTVPAGWLRIQIERNSYRIKLLLSEISKLLNLVFEHPLLTKQEQRQHASEDENEFVTAVSYSIRHLEWDIRTFYTQGELNNQKTSRLESFRDSLSDILRNIQRFEENVLKRNFGDNESALRTIKETRERLRKTASPIKQALDFVDRRHFHGWASERKARVHLMGRPPGSYLLLKAESGGWRICFVNANRRYRSVTIKAYSDGMIFCETETKRLPLADFLQVLSGSQKLYPIKDALLDPLQAPFLWNCICPDKPAPLLKQVGDTFVDFDDGAFFITYLDTEELSQTLACQLKENAVCCRDMEYKSLFDLLECYVGSYRLLNNWDEACRESLYYQTWLPMLHRKKVRWLRVSKKTHPTLQSSFWATVDGLIFSKGKVTLGKGGFKRVARLEPCQGVAPAPSLVSAVFHRHRATSDIVTGSEQLIKALKKDFGCDNHFLLPHSLQYHRGNNPKDEIRYGQVMEEMKGDLKTHWSKLSILGQLKALAQAAKTLDQMQKMGWSHLDVKPSNFMLRSPLDPSDPKVVLTDFDLALKVQDDQTIVRGTVKYKDPLIQMNRCKGPKAAGIADQFSFGMMALELLTCHLPRRKMLDIIVGIPVTRGQLEAASGWNFLDPGLQLILRRSLLGVKRTFQLPDIAKTLDQLILEERARALF